jgi:hypothetical protein
MSERRSANIDLNTGLRLIVIGIRGDWGLSDAEMSKILTLSLKEFNLWIRENRLPYIKDDPVRLETLYDFIEFYDSVVSLFPKKADQLRFLDSKLHHFDNETPLTLVKCHPIFIYEVTDWLDRLAAM